MSHNEIQVYYHAALTSECPPAAAKLLLKVVDIFGNDTMTIVEVSV